MKKKVLLISTGGTISQVHNEEGIAISNENSLKGNAFVKILNSVGHKKILNQLIQ